MISVLPNNQNQFSFKSVFKNKIAAPTFLNKEHDNNLTPKALMILTLFNLEFNGEISEEKKQIIIKDVFKCKSSIFEPKSDTFKKIFKGLNIKNTIEGNKQVLRIDPLIKNGASPVKGWRSLNSDNLPKFNYKIGKFDPTIEIVDKKLGIKVKLIPGAAIEGSEFGFTIPGSTELNGRKKEISFKGNSELQVITYNQEPATKKAVELYQEAKFHQAIPTGDFIEAVKKDEPTIMILAGGFGTRLYDYTGNSLNKPAAKLPTNPKYRLIANALDKAASMGILDGKNDKIKYLSGANTISGANVAKVIQDTDLGDGGCIAESLKLGETKTDKPLIVLNADTITNADITRAYKAFQDHPDAAILIPYYPVPKNKINSFGLITAGKPNEQKISEIKGFIEKPKTIKEAEDAKIGDKKMYRINPGIYILGTRALELLKNRGGEELGLANDFITPIVEMCKKGELLDKNGKPMKAYTIPLETKGGKPAYWDDLGKVGALINTTRKMAYHTQKTGSSSEKNPFYGMPKFLLKDAVNNVNLNTGIVYMSDEAKSKFEQFQKKYGIKEAKGNIIVFDNADS